MPVMTPRRRLLIAGLLAIFIVGVTLILVFSFTNGHLAKTPGLHLTAQAFQHLLLSDWLAGGSSADVTQGIDRLRSVLMVDSALLVPGYAGLFIVLTLSLGDPNVESRYVRHLQCLPVVVAAMFDVAENAMTGQALHDLLQTTLVDATVADVSRAGQVKWVALGVALLVLAVRLWRARRQVVMQGLGALYAGMAVASVSGVALVLGGMVRLERVVGLGALGLGVVLLGLGGYLIRAGTRRTVNLSSSPQSAAS